jgi:LysM repeat protein
MPFAPILYKHTNRLAIAGLLTVLFLGLALGGRTPSLAQGTELISNNSMDTYYGTGGSNVVPQGWTLTASYPVASDKQTWIFNEFPGYGSSWKVSAPNVVFTMVARQNVINIPKGTRLRFTAYSNVFTCDNDRSCIGANTPRDSDETSGAKTRIGIDPTGGQDAAAASVVWSNFISPYDRFDAAAIEAVAAVDGSVTIFMYSTQDKGLLLSHVYWDNASLQAIGTGVPGTLVGTPGTAAPAAAPLSVPFVTPQGNVESGNLIHVVASGDTLASIAVAYKTTIAEIRRLNNMPDGEYVIQPGQKLIVGAAPENVIYVIVTATFTPDPSNPVLFVTATPSFTASPTPTVTGTRTAGPPPVIIITLGPSPTPTPTAKNVGGALLAANLPGKSRVVSGWRKLAAQDQSSGSICATAFNDTNKSGFQDSAVVRSTDSEAATCFTGLGGGAYNLVAQVPAAFANTTPTEFRVELPSNGQIKLSFGAAQGLIRTEAAAVNNQTVAASNPLSRNGGLVLMGLAAVVLVGGLGLAAALRRA